MRTQRLATLLISALFMITAVATFRNGIEIYNEYGTQYLKTVYINGDVVSNGIESVATVFITSGMSVLFSLVNLSNAKALARSVQLNLLRNVEGVEFSGETPQNWFIETTPQIDFFTVSINNYKMLIPKKHIETPREFEIQKILKEFFNASASSNIYVDTAEAYETLGKIQDVFNADES